MRTHALRLLALSSALALSAAAATPDTATVPRAEYERLRADFEHLRTRLDQLAAPAPTVTSAPETTPMATPAETANRAIFRPGWTRTRDREWRWMDHSRYEKMNARIAEVGGFELFAGMQSAGRFQALDQKNVSIAGKDPAPLGPGFQTAWGSFEFLADFDQQLEVYFDVYMSTKAHPSQLQGHEGYMLMRSLPSPLGDAPLAARFFEFANVKAGQFDIDFGDHRYRRSDNARGQQNPFIGNTLFDPSATEVGVEIFSKPSRLNWLVGVGSGSEQGSFDAARNLSTHAKTWVNLDNLRLSASGYYLDHNLTSPAFSNLFRTSRSGGQYNGVLDNGNGPGAIFAGTGKRLSAVQADATWLTGQYELYGHVGWVKERPATGAEEWTYYTLDGVYRLTPRLYASARYTGANARQLKGTASDGHVDRIQIGGGYWLFNPVLFKLEYVYQHYRDFRAVEGAVSGVDAWRNPSFSGVVAEFTFAY